jgi:hypothetical protein
MQRSFNGNRWRLGRRSIGLCGVFSMIKTIKTLFFTVALLVPGLAYAGNPSADLTVQIVPGGLPGSILPPGNWTLAFNDEFNGTSIDTSKWTYPCPRCVVNGGDVIDTLAVVSFSNGHMVFTEEPDGTGGEVTSINAFGQGYYEARMIPGDGWSLFWIISTVNNNCAGDRTHGFEADIYENISSGGQHNVHWNGYRDCHQSEGCFDLGLPQTGEYVFGLWWTDSNLTFYVDGKQTCQIGGPNGALPHVIKLTVAGLGTGIPVRYDWVRYYQPAP